MSDTARDDRDRWIKIATVALHRAMADDLPGAAAYVKRLNGSPGLMVAIKGWVDTYLAQMHPEHKYGDPFRLRWAAIETIEDGDFQAAQEVDPALRWAGQLIAARAADDEAAFMMLLQLPAEGRELGDGIMSLLNVVATTLNNKAKVAAAEARFKASP